MGQREDEDAAFIAAQSEKTPEEWLSIAHGETWKGKLLEDCTKEELLACIRHLARWSPNYSREDVR